MLLRLDQLALQLSRCGMPRAQVARYMEELRDHRDDLLAEFQQAGIAPDAAQRLADERLGDPGSLARAALAAHRRRYFMGRHAWFFFAVLPAFAVPLTIILLMLVAIVGVLWASHGLDKESTEWSGVSWQVVVWGAQSVNYLWPGLLGIPLYRAGWRRGLSWRWRICSSAIVVAWGAWLHCATRAGDATHQGAFTMGSQALPYFTQAASAIAIIACYAWRLDCRARRALPSPQDHAAIPDGAIT